MVPGLALSAETARRQVLLGLLGQILWVQHLGWCRLSVPQVSAETREVLTRLGYRVRKPWFSKGYRIEW